MASPVPFPSCSRKRKGPYLKWILPLLYLGFPLPSHHKLAMCRIKTDPCKAHGWQAFLKGPLCLCEVPFDIFLEA